MRSAGIVILGIVLLSTGYSEAADRSSFRNRTKKGDVPHELKTDSGPEKIFTKNYGPKRSVPIFKEAFSVGLVLIEFPDTRMPSLQKIRNGVLKFGPMSISEYFKEYSQNTCWPMMFIVGEESFPKCVYKAPHPIGYYCEHDHWSNPIGYKAIAEGHQRAKELRSAAKKSAFSLFKRPPSSSGIRLKANNQPDVTCYGYAAKVVSPAAFKNIIRPHYNGLMKSYDKTKEAWDLYKPIIGWGDPLWPNSIPQIHVEGGGGTLCHELGHVLGAPDFYHAPEKHDGTPGQPCLSWAYGPTGPGYCRYIYNAFVSKQNYPSYTKSGTYTLYPRKTNPAGDKPIGCFIPSAHPHYMYYLEYVKGEKAPLGNPGRQGMLVHVINTTLGSPLLGAPDLCYTYRPNDPWFRSGGDLNKALLGQTTGRTSFTKTTDPASRLPNLMDGGVAIEQVQESSDSVSFKLTITPKPLNSSTYKYSLVPKIRLDDIIEILPTSMHAKSTVLFRGEPMKSDYGFCWATTKRPRISTSSMRTGAKNYFPLYHRDRYGARITGLRPGTKYYVRAYARNSYGISYSDEELTIQTLPLRPAPVSVPPLLQDNFSANWVIERSHGSAHDKTGDFVGSTAVTALLKLTAYYRKSLDPAKARAKGNIDYTRIHMNPSLNRPPARMKEFYAAMTECLRLASSNGMLKNTFKKDFDKHFMKAFKLRSSRISKIKPIENLSEASLEKLKPYIKESLINSNPILAVQDSVQLSPRGHGLSWVIIDGFKEGEFHLVYPRNKDRDFKRRTGWYPLKTLLIDVEEAKLIFVNPLA